MINLCQLLFDTANSCAIFFAMDTEINSLLNEIVYGDAAQTHNFITVKDSEIIDNIDFMSFDEMCESIEFQKQVQDTHTIFRAFYIKRIIEEKLHKNKYGTFKNFMNSVFNLSASRGYQLKKYAEHLSKHPRFSNNTHNKA